MRNAAGYIFRVQIPNHIWFLRLIHRICHVIARLESLFLLVDYHLHVGLGQIRHGNRPIFIRLLRANNLFINTLNGLSEHVRRLLPTFLDLPKPLIQPLLLNNLTLFIRLFLRLLMKFSRQINPQLFVLCPIVPQIILISSNIVLHILQVQLHLSLIPVTFVSQLFWLIAGRRDNRLWV